MPKPPKHRPKVLATGNIRKDMKILRSGEDLDFPVDDPSFVIDINYVRTVLRHRPKYPDGAFNLFNDMSLAHSTTVIDRIKGELETELGKFLKNLGPERQHVGWMVGELLGCDWPDHQGLNVLCDVIREGRYAHGRWCAAAGITSRLRKTRPEDAVHFDRNMLIDLLLRVLKFEPNTSVRIGAAESMKIILTNDLNYRPLGINASLRPFSPPPTADRRPSC